MLRNPARRRHDRRGMMAANVIERAQFPISPANNNERLAGQIKSKELPCIDDLVRVSYRNPIVAEHLFALQASNPLINIPCSRDGGSVFQRRLLIVKRQHVSERLVHNAISSLRAEARRIERCPCQYTATPEARSTRVIAKILNSARAGFGSSSAGNMERMIAANVEKNPMQASGMATRLPPGSRRAPDGEGRDCQ